MGFGIDIWLLMRLGQRTSARLAHLKLRFGAALVLRNDKEKRSVWLFGITADTQHVAFRDTGPPRLVENDLGTVLHIVHPCIQDLGIANFQRWGDWDRPKA